MAKPRRLYIRVGLLLLAGIILAIGFVLFLTAGRLSKTAEIAETYFSESVTGLEVGAPVRYRGVRVGQVAEIGLVNAEYRPDSRSQAAAAFQLVLVRLAIDPARATMQNVQEMQRAVESGLRARLASAGIARAMALDPRVLFLDEPSAGLDPITSAGLDQLIKDLARDLGTTFVVVTHELQSILAIGDRCIMLDKQAKGMIAEGDPRELRDHATHPTVRAFFRREAT